MATAVGGCKLVVARSACLVLTALVITGACATAGGQRLGQGATPAPNPTMPPPYVNPDQAQLVVPDEALVGRHPTRWSRVVKEPGDARKFTVLFLGGFPGCNTLADYKLELDRRRRIAWLTLFSGRSVTWSSESCPAAGSPAKAVLVASQPVADYEFKDGSQRPNP